MRRNSRSRRKGSNYQKHGNAWVRPLAEFQTDSLINREIQSIYLNPSIKLILRTKAWTFNTERSFIHSIQSKCSTAGVVTFTFNIIASISRAALMSPRFSLSNQRVSLTNDFKSGWLAGRVTRRRFHFCVIGVMSRGFRKATVAGVYAAQPARTREPIRPVMHGLSISGGVRKRTLACVRGCAIGRCGARRTEKREQGRRRRRRRWRRKRWRKRRRQRI